MIKEVSVVGDSTKKNGSHSESREIPPADDRLIAPAEANGANGRHKDASSRNGTHGFAETPEAAPAPASGDTPFSLEQLLAASGDAILVIRPNRTIRYANPTTETIYGLPIGTLAGLTFDDLYPPESFPPDQRPLDHFLQYVQQGGTYLVEDHFCRITRRWYECRVQPLALGPEELGAMIVIRDVDARRSAEARYERSSRASQAGICEIDYVRDRAEYSLRWKEMTGCFDLPENADATTRRAYWWNRVHPDDRERLDEHYHRWHSGNDTFNSITFRLGFQDEQGNVHYRWFIERGGVERDPQGNLLRTTWVLNDLTRIKEAEERLAAEKARFERAMEAVNEGLWETDLTVLTDVGEGVTYRSPVWKRLMGVENLEPTADDPYYRQVIRKRIHPDDLARYETVRRSFHQEGKSFARVEFRILQRDGSYRWAALRGQAQRDADGKLVRIIGIVADIHDRKTADLEIAEAHARFERAAAATNDGIWEFDFVHHTCYRSARWREMADIPDDLPNTLPTSENGDWEAFWKERIHPEDWGRVAPQRNSFRSPRAWADPQEFRIRNRAGEYRWIAEHFEVERAEDGTILRVVGVMADIHDRKTVELTLAERERFLTQIARVLPTLLYVYDRRDHTCLYLNDELTDMLGYLPEEIQVLGPGGAGQLTHPDDASLFAERAAAIDGLSDDDVIVIETRVQHKNGEYRWLRVRHVPFARDEKGWICQIVGVAEDITVQKQAEEERRLLLDRYRLAALGTRTGIWEWDGENDVWYRSPEWKEILGYTGEYEKDCPQNASIVAHPDDTIRVNEAFADLLAGRAPVYDLTYRLRHRDGSWRWLHSRAVLFKREDSGALRVIGVYSDVTVLKLQEAAVQQTSARLGRAIDASRDAIWEMTLDPSGSRNGYLYRSPQFWAMFGFDSVPEDKIDPETGKWPEFDGEDVWQARIHPDDYSRLKEHRSHVFESGEGMTETEYRILRNDGEYRWVLSQSRVERDAAGNPTFLTGVIADIHERKMAEQAIRQSEARYRALTLATSDGIFRADAEGSFIWLSPALLQAVSPAPSTPDSVSTPDLFAQVHPEDRDRVRQAWQTSIVSRQPVHLRCRIRARVAGAISADVSASQAAGTFWRPPVDEYAYHHWRVRAVPLEETDGTVSEWIGAVTDVTEQVTQEEAIQQSEERYRGLVELSSLGVWRMRGDRESLWVSTELARAVGLSSLDHEALRSFTRALYDRIHPDDVGTVIDLWQESLATSQPFDYIYRIRVIDQDGAESWRSWRERGVLIAKDDVHLREWVGTIEDVTDRQDAEEVIRRSESRFRALVEASTDGVWLADPNGRIMTVSGSLERDYLLPESRDWRDLVEQDHITPLSSGPDIPWEEAVASHSPYSALYRMLRRDGQYRWQQFRAVPVFAADNSVQEYIGSVQDVTERVEAEMRVRESEARLKEAQRITHSGHFRYELFESEPGQGTEIRTIHNFWSDEMYRIFERDPAEGPPSEAYTARYYAPEDLMRLQTAQERARRNGMPYIAELPIMTERGTKKWIQLHHRTEYDAAGQIVAVYGAVVDITAFKALEESLRQAQQLARRIALAVPDLLYVYDLEGGQTRYANRSIAQVLGFGPDDPALLPFPNVWTGVGDNVNAFINSRLHPADTSAYLAAVHQLRHAADGEVVEVVVRLRHKDGSWRTFYGREIIFSRDERTGLPHEVLGVTQDITEKIEAEDMRRESEEKYRSLVDLLSDWVWECDPTGRYVYISGQVTRRLGYRPDEMVGLSLSDFAAHDERDRLIALLQGYAQRSQSFTRLPVRVIGITGESIYLEVSGVPLIANDGTLQGFRGVAYDVTVRKQTENQLRSSEERMRRVIESSPDCMQILDLSGRMLSVNEAGRRLLSLTDAEAVRGSYWPGFWDGEWRQVAEDAVTRAGSGETRRFIGFTRSSRGAGRWWDVVITPLPDSQGRPDQLLVVSRDISAQKSLEQQKDQLLADAMQRAERDPLTGLFDHQAFHKRLQEEGKRADRDDIPFAVAVLDVDNFKYFNDAFGHLEGDAVLLHITNALRSTCRPTDCIGRLGGDEFAVILPGVTKQDAMRLLESRLQANAFASRWQPRGYDAPIPLRISFGVAVYPDESSTPLSALSLADERLYRNKKEGQAGLLEHLRAELSKTMVGFPMLDALVTAVDSKDRYTRKHSEDVLIYAVMIGQALGLSDEDLALLRPAALLHDVGKIGVSQRILRLPTALTSEEYEAIKQHAPLGAALVEVLLASPQNIGAGLASLPLPAEALGTMAAVTAPLREQMETDAEPSAEPFSAPRRVPPELLRKLVAAVRHHHEAWDGSGYPDRLTGEDIPLLARVLAVADAFSALTTDRPYRRGANPEQAVAVLQAGAGQQWDRECVDAFIRVVETSRARALAALGAISESADNH